MYQIMNIFLIISQKIKNNNKLFLLIYVGKNSWGSQKFEGMGLVKKNFLIQFPAKSGLKNIIIFCGTFFRFVIIIVNKRKLDEKI